MKKQPIDDKMSTRWGLAALKSVGVSIYGDVGGNLRVFDLINMETYRAHRMTIVDGSAGVGLPVSISLLSNDYTYFETKRPANFSSFDGRRSKVSTVDLAFYSWTTVKIFTNVTTPLAEVKSSGWGLATPEVSDSEGVTEIYYSDGRPVQDPRYDVHIDIPTEETFDGFKVVTSDDAIVIKLSGDVLFDFDKDLIHYQASEVLSKVIRYINSKQGFKRIRIEGHTDSKEITPGHNLVLSRGRAKAVKEYFVKYDVFSTPYVIETEGFAATKPVAPNTNPDGSDNPAGREKNRRVEIYLYKK
jgi:outer membrane protein OmpA-like peptidoglycan-associated protein